MALCYYKFEQSNDAKNLFNSSSSQYDLSYVNIGDTISLSTTNVKSGSNSLLQSDTTLNKSYYVDTVSLRATNYFQPTNFTASIWFYYDTTSTPSYPSLLYTIANVGLTELFSVCISTSGSICLYFVKKNTFNNTVKLSTSLPSSKFYNLVIMFNMYDGYTGLSVYLDGTPVSVSYTTGTTPFTNYSSTITGTITGSPSVTSTGYPITLGFKLFSSTDYNLYLLGAPSTFYQVNGQGPTYNYNKAIDEVSFFNNNLIASQIARLQNLFLPIPPVITTSGKSITTGAGSLSCGDVFLGTSKDSGCGIFWNYGGSKIYDENNLIISSDDNINIISATGAGGWVNVCSGTYDKPGTLQAGNIVISSNEGIYWNNGGSGSRIYDNGNLKFESNDTIEVLLNSGGSGGALNVYNIGSTTTNGKLNCGETNILGNIHITQTSITAASCKNGIYWDYGYSKIYDDSELTIESDNNVHIMLNSKIRPVPYTNGVFKVYSGDTSTYGPVKCGQLTAGNVYLTDTNTGIYWDNGGLSKIYDNYPGQLTIQSDDYIHIRVNTVGNSNGALKVYSGVAEPSSTGTTTATGKIECGDTTITGNLNINLSGTNTSKKNGIYWNYGGSKIYDSDNLTLESDDNIDIIVYADGNSGRGTDGALRVFKGNTTAFGDIYCAGLNCRGIITNNNNVAVGTGGVVCGSILGTLGSGLTIFTGSGTGNLDVYRGNASSSTLGNIQCGELKIGGVSQYGSRIYDDGNMTLSSDDYVDIVLNSNPSYNGNFRVFSGNKNTSGNIQCGKLTAYSGISITGTAETRSGVYAYLNSVGTNYWSTTTNSSYSLYVDGRIGTTAEINVWSDKRIKTNITNITHDYLEIVRKLEPVKFNYIDFLKNTKNKDTIGFIAQDVFDVLPDAVSNTTDIIPNIYDIGILNPLDIITLKTKKTSEFSFNSSPSKNIKIKLFVNNKEEFVYLDEIIDDTTIRLTEPITTEITDNSENHIFVYGQEVNDLLTIEKNAIFTMAVGAIKELDAELQETKTTVKKLQEQVEVLMAKLK